MQKVETTEVILGISVSYGAVVTAWSIYSINGYSTSLLISYDGSVPEIIYSLKTLFDSCDHVYQV